MLKVKRIFSNVLGSSESKAVEVGNQYDWAVSVDSRNHGIASLSVLPEGAAFLFKKKMPEDKFSGEPESLLSFTVNDGGDVLHASGIMAYGFEGDCNGLVAIFYNIIANHEFTKKAGSKYE